MGSMRTWLWVSAWLIGAGCGGRCPDAGDPPVARLDRPAAPAPERAIEAQAAPPLTEAEARAVLSQQFRARGLRIRQDVMVNGVAIDGYDPDRQIGFEYVAADDLALPAAARAGLPGILVLDAATAEQVTARASEFLARRLRSGSDPEPPLP
jgi:hypothetical protein